MLTTSQRPNHIDANCLDECPADVADLARFLLSDESRFITGQTIVVSGGRVMLP
jgi:NAD(P)-dependent dehydrogenase (short-subunit alcohol dehydrogenase family)